MLSLFWLALEKLDDLISRWLLLRPPITVSEMLERWRPLCGVVRSGPAHTQTHRQTDRLRKQARTYIHTYIYTVWITCCCKIPLEAPPGDAKAEGPAGDCCSYSLLLMFSSAACFNTLMLFLDTFIGRTILEKIDRST